METKTLSVRDFYRVVWPEYADPVFHPITAQALSAQVRTVAHRIREARPRRVLDLGCGPVPVVREQSAPLVVSADLVYEMLLQIKASRASPVVCLDARRLPFRDHCFDFIWCGLLIDHIREPDGWIQELARVLAPGSLLGVACWNRSALPSDRDPEHARMCYTTAQGEELAVMSFPTWETTLRMLEQMDPNMEMEPLPIAPPEYVLQVAWARVPA